MIRASLEKGASKWAMICKLGEAIGYPSTLNPTILQHLPDFKGIETNCTNFQNSFTACSTSLTSKGLRRRRREGEGAHAILQHLPDFKGIETCELRLLLLLWPCSTSLTSKGLRLSTSPHTNPHAACSTSLTSKGLRHERCSGLIQQDTFLREY